MNLNSVYGTPISLTHCSPIGTSPKEVAKEGAPPKFSLLRHSLSAHSMPRLTMLCSILLVHSDDSFHWWSPCPSPQFCSHTLCTNQSFILILRSNHLTVLFHPLDHSTVHSLWFTHLLVHTSVTEDKYCIWTGCLLTPLIPWTHAKVQRLTNPDHYTTTAPKQVAAVNLNTVQDLGVNLF